MDYEFLKAKMDKFLNETSGEQIIGKFEALGYKFIEQPLSFKSSFLFDPANYLDCGSLKYQFRNPNSGVMEWANSFYPPIAETQDWEKYLNKNLTPNFPGSFFLCNIAI